MLLTHLYPTDISLSFTHLQEEATMRTLSVLTTVLVVMLAQLVHAEDVHTEEHASHSHSEEHVGNETSHSEEHHSHSEDHTSHTGGHASHSEEHMGNETSHSEEHHSHSEDHTSHTGGHASHSEEHTGEHSSHGHSEGHTSHTGEHASHGHSDEHEETFAGFNATSVEELQEKYDANKDHELNRTEVFVLWRDVLGQDLLESQLACVEDVLSHTHEAGHVRTLGSAEMHFLLVNAALVKAYQVCEHSYTSAVGKLMEMAGGNAAGLEVSDVKMLYRLIMSSSAPGVALEDDHSDHAHGRVADVLVRSGQLLAEDDHEGEHEHAHAHECQGYSKIVSTVDDKDTLSAADVTSVVEAVLLDKVNGCVSDTDECTRPSRSERYGYTVLAVSLLTFLSMVLVIVAVPLLMAHPIVLQVMLSFAIGALLGDAFFHIVPILMGVHGGVSEGLSDADINGRLAVALATVLVFYWVDAVSRIVLGGDSVHDKAHEEQEQVVSPTEPANEDEENVAKDAAPEKEKPGWFSWTPLAQVGRIAWVVVIADGCHNITDGLSIGASFSRSKSLGLSTSLAVCFHEIPQEVADFAILLSSGMSPLQAVIMNGLSGATSIVAGIIACIIGDSSKDAEPWMLAVTLGSFVYLALGVVLPEVLEAEKGQHSVLNMIMCSLGMAAGATVLWIIAITEDHGSC